MEHFLFRQTEVGVQADGLILRFQDGQPFRLHYWIFCDPNWRVRQIIARLLAENSKPIVLNADGKGNWTDGNGDRISALEGCLDVDISATPFTNSLTIRRLQLQRGESAKIQVVYLAVPEMKISREPQRYTCLEVNPPGGVYKFESLTSEFVAELLVDADGLVLDYPQLFVRVNNVKSDWRKGA